MATTSNSIPFYAYKEPTITTELTMIENGPRIAESTIQQQECEITEEINETFDFIDYVKLINEEMLEQLENNKNKDQPLYQFTYSENNKSWEWFFTKLRKAYGVREDQCIISDRHESIIKATNKVFPYITPGYCMFHLLSNLKTSYKKHAKEYNVAFFGVATTYTEKKFEYHIKELDNLDKRIRPYLQKIGYHKWSRFYSKNKRYLVMTSNIAESLNLATVVAREVPAITLLKCLRGLIQDWTYTNRKLAKKTMTRLTPVAEQAFTNNFVYSLRLTIRLLNFFVLFFKYFCKSVLLLLCCSNVATVPTQHIIQVKPANEYLFEVFKEDKSWIVNLKERICTCNRFKKDEMPCAHALVVMKEMNIDPYDYCSHYYTTKAWLETYDATVYQIGKQRDWELPDFFKDIIVLPPFERVRVGRPKKRRIIFAWETKKKNKCSKCGQRGHNKKTCRTRPPRS
ncbi:uncharacterized protein LOC133785066 [Humulus lupulus]|uniref:uncharacterized protein LOC133785066 n=1 Tax=Humulus lupulus TaxID=3486 RepID=UPI002B401108|nr:uncharacterized protein LOC133785066 [Humulus lupulus]